MLGNSPTLLIHFSARFPHQQITPQQTSSSLPRPQILSPLRTTMGTTQEISKHCPWQKRKHKLAIGFYATMRYDAFLGSSLKYAADPETADSRPLTLNYAKIAKRSKSLQTKRLKSCARVFKPFFGACASKMSIFLKTPQQVHSKSAPNLRDGLNNEHYAIFGKCGPNVAFVGSRCCPAFREVAAVWTPRP